MDRFLYDQSLDEIAASLRRSVELCGRQDRFVFMDPGGTPEDIDTERYLAIRSISRRERGQPDQ
jgi:hypothetical protein